MSTQVAIFHPLKILKSDVPLSLTQNISLQSTLMHFPCLNLLINSKLDILPTSIIENMKEIHKHFKIDVYFTIPALKSM